MPDLEPLDLNRYGPGVAALLQVEVDYPLGPGEPYEADRVRLEALSNEAIFGEGVEVTNDELADACRSGLWLRFNFLDESHTISQDLPSNTGSYWHGIMHRREPDYSNAKYWFRQVGDHPIFDDLAGKAASLAAAANVEADWSSGDWDPFAFVDACQEAARHGGGLAELCRQVSLAEWRLLFDFCHQGAIA